MKKSLTKNFVYNLSYEIITIVIPFITAPYLTRVLGANNMGKYSYIQSIVNYFLLFAMLGFSISGNRLIAKVRDNQKILNQTFSSIYYSQLLISTVMVLFYYAYCIVTHKEKIYYILGIFIISSICNICWLYNGCEDFKFTATINTIIKIFAVICMFLFVKEPNDLFVYCFIMAGTQLLTNIIFFISHKRNASLCKTDIRSIVVNFKEALILFVPVISASVYKLMDKIMIGSITGNMIGVSNYYYAEQILSIPSGVIMALSTVLLPRMSYNFSNKDTKKSIEIANIIIVITVFIACLIACGIAGVAKVFVPLYLGNQYLECGNYVIFLAITAVFISWTTMMRTIFLIPMKQDKIYITSVISGALVNIVMNSILIKKIGIEGAIIGTICAEFVVMLIQTIAVYKIFSLNKIIFKSLPFIVIGIIMTAICIIEGKLLEVTWITLFIQIITGGVIYVGLSLGYLFFMQRDLFKKLYIYIKLRRKK